MKILERTKPYKAKTPEETIDWCKKVLRENKLTTYEEVFTSHVTGDKSFWYCRVGFVEFPNYSAGGKGCSKSYALASGYGELLERLQNNLLFPLPENRAFRIAGDEKMISADKIVEDNYAILSFIFPNSNEQELKRIIKNYYGNNILTVPYYDYFKRGVHYFPVSILENYINMFNGNCAGNTPKEAIIHGLCEIIERYVVREIYKSECRLPDIPLKFFKGSEIYDKIKSLESLKNIKIVIKDCSLGERLPVIGALLIDRNTNKYSFQLGADPSPLTALERCLTEIFQDGREFAHYTHLAFDPFDSGDSNNRFINKAKHFAYTNDFAKGKWPNEIFLKSESEFKGFEYYRSESDDKDLDYLFDLLKTNNRQIYIRDVSYLGFPSFNIYIPGMSEYVITDPLKFIQRQKTFIKCIPILKNIDGEDINNLRDLANQLDSLVLDPEPFIPFQISLFFKNINDKLCKGLNNDLFLFMLFYRTSNLKKASFYIKRYIVSSGVSEAEINPYYLCVRDYVSLKCKNENNLKEVLGFIYDVDVVEEVIGDLNDNSLIFKNLSLPSCPNCITCHLRDDCSLLVMKETSERLFEKMVNSRINQNQIGSMLNGNLKHNYEYIA